MTKEAQPNTISLDAAVSMWAEYDQRILRADRQMTKFFSQSGVAGNGSDHDLEAWCHRIGEEAMAAAYPYEPVRLVMRKLIQDKVLCGLKYSSRDPKNWQALRVLHEEFIDEFARILVRSKPPVRVPYA